MRDENHIYKKKKKKKNSPQICEHCGYQSHFDMKITSTHASHSSSHTNT